MLKDYIDQSTADVQSAATSETNLRSMADQLTAKPYLNYKGINAMGHPTRGEGSGEWSHGAATAGWARVNFLNHAHVTEGIGGNTVSLSSRTPWQGVVAIDNNDVSSVDISGVSPGPGDVIDAVVYPGASCMIIFPSGPGIIDGQSPGEPYIVGSNSQVRLTCVDPTTPVYVVDSLSYDDFIRASLADAVATGLENNFLGGVGRPINFNGARGNSMGDPDKDGTAYPRSVGTIGYNDAHYLATRGVTHVHDGGTYTLTQAAWQAVISRSRVDGEPLIPLPVIPLLGDRVLLYVAQGTDNVLCDAGGGDGADIGSEGRYDDFGPNAYWRLVCTNPTGPVWSVTSLTRAQFQDECASQAVGLALQAGGLAQQVALSLAAARTVIWRPFASPGDGYVTTWADAVTAVNLVDGPTTIQIIADPDNDTVTIPGGTWQLNQTTLVGKAVGADTDTDYRGWQELLYVVTAGDPANPCQIKGCVGLKDMYFRATDYAWGAPINGGDGTITNVSGSTVTFQKGIGIGPAFIASDVGKPIRIGNVSPYQSFGSDVATAGNRGTFLITVVIDVNTVQYENGSADAGDANNGSIGWSKCTSVFILTDSAGTGAPSNFGTEFTLDNVDFRFGGDYNWGSFYVGYDGELFLHLKNAASIRWFSLIIDGYLVVQTDGGGSWVGSSAFNGNGNVQVFPMSGSQIRTYQPAISSWTLHQPYTVYLVNDGSKWGGLPASVNDALDQLADRLTTTETGKASVSAQTASTQPGFTGAAPVTAFVQVNAGTGMVAAGQTMTSGDNKTATMDLYAGCVLATATTNSLLFITGNAACSGAPLVLTVYGTPVTDVGAYQILAAPTPTGTVDDHTHTQQV